MNPSEIKRQRMEVVFQHAQQGANTSAAIAKSCGFPQERVQDYLSEMDKKGLMFRASVRPNETYWYTTKELALQKLREHRESKKSAPLVHIAVKVPTRFADGAQIVIPKGVKVQKCPGYRGDRFAHTGKVEGGFASLGPGRYLESDEAMLRRISRKGA